MAPAYGPTPPPLPRDAERHAPTPPNSLHLFPPPGNNCDMFTGGAATDPNSLHVFPPPGNNCDKFGCQAWQVGHQ